MKLFDSHCHLQDPRILARAPRLIELASNHGVVRFAVNGVHEKDWYLVKQMSEDFPCTVPNFGLHPWYVLDRSPDWFKTLKQLFEVTPTAAVGEIGLDKGSHGKKIDFDDQVQVFERQLELAKELNRPASVHCVRAFADVLGIMKSVGPFPCGVVLHSYLGSAEMVPQFAELGAYFSFSGFLMSMKESKAKRMLKAVPPERILLESDAPDALPKSELEPLIPLDSDSGSREESSSSDISGTESLNHPANVRPVLSYVARLLEMSTEELADRSYENAMRVFSF
ncbi:uncharacterized protein LOC116201026 [Punica granatum]|uniref:Uncharacterized protein LOC116201026 n=2 Tax=Punica granatum TaxID=22663 RepID=A0A6P8CTD0_PUNGR|nr:uncharacterized protein LOC116201026 [Punica granatum]XP_031387950.1 uncharacterized protein LOC116201026 [Punica granatum]XP_031387951.1 uncharacterized protein LOC116201026 [Punica granatum]XP_031387952.1 uncharacterized protein LOC116201026 [Punica granatum]OWM66583.1 hypothetical protein CDL15_Pgr013800 [Punica granatum]PKI34820.1 hypothetical protein CRG98_044791 [Punica granatum]